MATASWRAALTPAGSADRAEISRAAISGSWWKGAGAREASWPMAWYRKPRRRCVVWSSSVWGNSAQCVCLGLLSMLWRDSYVQ